MNRAGLAFISILIIVVYATPALPQTSISTEGVIESKQGGFKFPDGTIRETAKDSAAGMSCVYPYVVTGFTDTGNCHCSNDKECRQPGVCPNLEGGSSCATAIVYPSISGDTGSDYFSVSDYGEKWIVFEVEESASAVEKLTFQASLTVPAGTDYDLEVLCSGCNDYENRLISNNPGSTTEILDVGWEDDFGSDQSRDVYVHVQFFSSADCLENNWTLEITGNVVTSNNNCPLP